MKAFREVSWTKTDLSSAIKSSREKKPENKTKKVFSAFL